MMTEQMNVPKLRFSEFEEHLLKSTTLKNVLTLFNGFAFKSTDSAESGVRWIKIADVGIQEISDKNVSYLPAQYLEKYKKFKLNEGDIVVALTRPVLNGKLKIAYIDSDSKDSLLNQRVGKLLSSEHLDYVYYLVQCKRVITSIVQNIAGTDPPNLAPSEINHIRASIPTLPEQQKIASFLSKVDEKIGLLTEKKDKLTEYKKGVMQQLFNGKWGYVDGKDEGQLTFIPPTLRFKADDGSEFPDWEEKKGGEMFSSISNKNHNSDLPVLAITQNQGAIPRDQINYNISVAETSVASYKVVEKGDFIISLRSFQGGIEYSEYTGICSPAYVILRPKKEISDYFYKFYLKTFPFIVEMQKRLEGIRDGKIISYKYFSEIPMPYPSIAEQEKIVQFLTAIDQKIELANSELEKAKEWKKGLLQQMFV
ncbi:restriction endonuclease subunit S [Vibrio breoganii]|uniref:restriction endonuclease subunit S n=1 Tax=Vibrio breoganii TaxID=553239 RepID=UPI0003091A62|nr:restriction endonuclease subunit S [Vibrio breoganii]OED95180.1 hypothetical protein A1QE_15845 [Vibrio breoganii ZF-55]